MRRNAKPAKAKVAAKPTVVYKSRKNEGSRVGDLETRLAEALKLKVEAFEQQTATAELLETRTRELAEAQEQQTATAEILHVISSSPTDLQPVFDAIAERAMHLCGASTGWVSRFDGELVHLVARANVSPEVAAAVQSVYPVPPSRRTAAARAILTGGLVQIPDVREDPEYGIATQVGAAFRSVAAVPMLQKGKAIGAVAVGRPDPGPFSERQIALLQTFADQAVIAIENVRLFNETKEALEQQTATSEILRVIASSPTDLQPVFDTIAERSMRLCEATFGWVMTFDGELMHLRSLANVSPEGVDALRQVYPMAPSRGSASGRTILTGDVVQIPDVLDDPEYEFKGTARATNFRAGLTVPLLHQGRPIGVIAVSRPEPGAFSAEHIKLLKTFADQAVIAIENVRLFRELQERTRELARSVEELHALGEVGQAVSSTLDVETVLQTIVSRAQQLAGTEGCSIFEYDQATDEFHLRATQNYDVELVEAARAMPLRRGEGVIGLAAERREPIQVSDIAEEGVYQSRLRDILLRMGYRALLAVPLVREEQIIGALSVNRKLPGEFAPFARRRRSDIESKSWGRRLGVKKMWTTMVG